MFFINISLAIPGLADPLLSFITCPTKNCNTDSFPFLNSITELGLASKTFLTISVKAPSSET